MNDSTRKEVTRLLKRGLNHYGLGELDSAIDCWESAQSLDPSNRAVHDYLETAYEESGLERKPDPPASTSSSGVDLDATAHSDPNLGPVSKPDAPLVDAEVLEEAPEPASAPSLGPAFDEDETPRTFDGPPGVPTGAHTPPPPVADSSAEHDPVVAGALEAYKRGELSEAWDALQRVAQANPARLDVQGYLAMVRSECARHWAREIGDQGRVLTLSRSMQEILTMNLTPDEGFLLSQIDGSLSIEELLNLSNDRVRALEIIAKFLRDGLVQ